MTALLHRAQSRAAAARGRKKERREKAAKAQRRLSRLLEKSRVAVCELTPELLIRIANPAAARLCGADAEELSGKRIFEVLEPIGAEDLASKWSAPRLWSSTELPAPMVLPLMKRSFNPSLS